MHYVNSERVLELANDDNSINDIQRKTGYSRKTISRILKENNIFKALKSNRKIQEEEENHILEQYQNGHSIREIVKETGRSDLAIRRVLDKKGAKPMAKKKPEVVEVPIGMARRVVEVKTTFKPPYLCSLVDKRTGRKIDYYDDTSLYIDRGFADIPEWKIQYEKDGIANYGLGFYKPPTKRRKVRFELW